MGQETGQVEQDHAHREVKAGSASGNRAGRCENVGLRGVFQRRKGSGRCTLGSGVGREVGAILGRKRGPEVSSTGFSIRPRIACICVWAHVV